MKRIILSTIALLFAVVMSAQNLYVGSYNVRNRNGGDEKNGNVWATRCKVMCDMINFEAPDVFGTQEVLVGQLRDMRAALDNYDFIGVGRDDGKEAGEYAAIFYKKDNLKLLHNGNFWLNETPDTPKLGWDAVCIRICTWGEFEQKATGSSSISTSTLIMWASWPVARLPSLSLPRFARLPRVRPWW